MFVEDPEQGLKIKAIAGAGAVLEMEAVTADRAKWLGQRLAIARQNNIISHVHSAFIEIAFGDPWDQNGRKIDMIDMESMIRFCSALIEEPSTITMSPA